MRIVLIWCAAAILAVIAGASAFGAVTKHKRPDLALRAWPPNGFAFAELADVALKKEVRALGGQLPGRLDRKYREWARQALSAEPTSIVAMRTLGLFGQGEGRDEQARNLMRLAVRSSRRDTIVNLWLINDYSQAGDIDATLEVYDQTLRTLSYERRGFLLTTMARALADPIFVEPYYHLLRRSPPWGEAFWRQAAQTAPAMENAARLRIRLARGGTGPNAETDAMLLSGLIGQRKYDAARTLHAALRTKPTASSDNILVNGDFSQAADLPPFDWKLNTQGELGAGINTRSGVLEISAVDGARGVVAEQLVHLAPDQYHLQARLAGSAQEKDVPAHIEISCATSPSNAREPFDIGLSYVEVSRSVDLRQEVCDYYWVRIVVAAEEREGAVEFALDRLLLTRG